MKFNHRQTSVEELLTEISNEALDLKPSFQRGEVWSLSKKQRLVDSILRDWYVPPIHVVDVGDGNREVLDGQQRLRAIVDFASDMFPVESRIDPENSELDSVHGLTYSSLPPKYRQRFDDFRISVFTLTDYTPSEPGELFFRLNQPATLTTAEQRNAFYGRARDQVKQWVRLLEQKAVNESVIGFSNARMAYDDTLARVAMSLEQGTIEKKVTADDLVTMYRSRTGYSKTTDQRIRRTIDCFSEARSYFSSDVRFNKATLYSWLIFVARAQESFRDEDAHSFAEMFGDYVSWFSSNLKAALQERTDQQSFLPIVEEPRLYLFFQDRATSRVADVLSVVLRDLVIWIALSDFIRSRERYRALNGQLRPWLTLARKIYRIASGSSPFDEAALEEAASANDWGNLK